MKHISAVYRLCSLSRGLCSRWVTKPQHAILQQPQADGALLFISEALTYICAATAIREGFVTSCHELQPLVLHTLRTCAKP